MKKIIAYCLEWHIKNSDAFRDMLVEPLKSIADIKLVAWDGDSLPQKPKKGETLIFCMLPPDSNTLARKDLRLIWLPMWDQAQGYSQDWWSSLPQNLHVVAFSDVIYKKSKAAKLSTLRITYYKNPLEFPRVTWKNGPVVFYWNRTGMIGPTFIEKLCSAIKPTELFYMSKLDPRIDENKFYELPSVIGKTKITNIEPSDRKSFLNKTKDCNILIAPRLTEGVGMTFLESMCRGGVVVAHNAPTMSEYIRHGQNGILLDNNYFTRRSRLSAQLKYRILTSHNPSPYLLSDKQPWKDIAKMNLEAMGETAYYDHVLGFKQWQKDIQIYGDFVLN